MSKLHDLYKQKKAMEKPDDLSFFIDASFWEDLIEAIQDLCFTEAPNTVKETIPEWHVLIYNGIGVFIKKGTPQICKFQRLAASKTGDDLITYTFTKELADCDEIRCPVKYDAIMNELDYVLSNYGIC